MKVLIVNKFLHPNGGSETYIFEVGKQLQKMGHQVEYFGMEHEGRVVSNRLDCYTGNMDFHTGKLQKLRYPFQILYSTEAAKKIRKVLDDLQPDVVHVNNFNFQLTPSILYAIRKYEKQTGRTVRIVYTAHDSQLVCPNHLMQRPSGKLCQECLGQKQWNCTKHKCIHNSRVKSLLGSVEAKIYQHNHAYRMFDTVICPSHFLEEVLKTNPDLDGKTVTMHNFLPEQELYPVKKEDYVLYFGRFSEEKGIKTLLKACEKLNDIPFVFAGKGPLENEVNQLKNVKNIGFTKGKKLYQTIAAAKFVVFPSEWYENCPCSVIEAQYYGTPVIASRIGGTVELIKEGMTGEFFEPGNQKELEEKIRNLWGDSERLEEYTRNCKETDFLNLDEYCEKLLQIYGGLKA